MPTTRVSDIISIASGISKISEKDIRAHSRFRHIARVRQAAMYVAAEQGVHSYSHIGRAFGKDRASVRHAHNTIGYLIQRDTELAVFVARIRELADKSSPFVASNSLDFLIPVAA